jgi:hypothetical protein
MASGILGQVSLATTANTTVYTVPSSTVGYVNFNMVNTNTTNVTVRVALAQSATPTSAEWIEYDAIIPGNGVLERTGFVMNASKNLVVRTNTSGVSVSAYGVEESA